MGYRPSKVTDRIKGFGTIQVGKTGKVVRITLLNKDGSSSIYDVQKFPKQVRSGRAFVWLENYGRQLATFLPADSALLVKVSKFISKEGEKPSLKENPDYDQPFFSVELVVVDGVYEGLKFIVTFSYFIQESITERNEKGESLYGLDGTKNIVWNDSITSFGRFDHFLEQIGFYDLGPLPYKPDMVSLMAQVASRSDKAFRCITSAKGKVYDFQPETSIAQKWDDTINEFDEEFSEPTDTPLKPDVEIEDGIEEFEAELESGVIVNFDDDSIWEEE